MNEIAEWITKHLSSFVEVLAAIVIGLALLQFLYRYATSIFKSNVGTINGKRTSEFYTKVLIYPCCFCPK